LSWGAAWSALGWHRDLVIDLRDRSDQHALFAVAYNHHLAVLTAFEHGFKVVQPQITPLPFLTMAAKTRGLEEGTDVLRVSYVLFVGRRRQLAEVKAANIPFVSGSGGPTGQSEAQ
jgi:hypothetical protein